MTTEPNHSSSAEIVDNKNNELLVRAQQFSGPIPHPEILELYNKVVPGAAERILCKDKFSVDPRRTRTRHSRKITVVSVLAEERPSGRALPVGMSLRDSSTGRRFSLALVKQAGSLFY